MQALTLDELDREHERYDACVDASGDVDPYCSSSDWVVPAARALMPGREPWLWRGEHGYVALARSRQPGFFLEPLEAMWGLACPLVGPDPVGLAGELAALLGRTRRAPDALVLCGLRPRSDRLAALLRALQPRFRLGLGPTCTRFCASLDGGLDGFLSRRSANLRLSLKRAQRRAREHGITFEPVQLATADTDAAYQRLLAVESQSWKGQSGVGFAHSEMLGFYRVMLPRLARRNALRLMFARHEGRDIAYILGGLRGTRYRGLQFSYASGWESFSLGNLCQLAQITTLCAEGVTTYDLGADVEYKRRWGEREEVSITLIAARA